MGLMVLVVVADDLLRGVMAIALRADGHRVQPAANDAIARERLGADQPDLLVLDSLTPLPEPAEQWADRHAPGVPLVLLAPNWNDTPQPHQSGTVRLAMPFGREALRQAVSSSVRDERRVSEVQLEVDELVLGATGTVWRAGVPVDLSPTERRMLTTLAAHPDASVRSETLIEAAWETVAPSSAAYLALYIGNLRQKLEVNPASPRFLRAVRGGYTLTTTAATRR